MFQKVMLFAKFTTKHYGVRAYLLYLRDFHWLLHLISQKQVELNIYIQNPYDLR